jgi:hypothetical protein
MTALLIDPRQVTLEQLRNVVGGKDASLPRGPAMDLLRASASPDRHRDFAAVLRNEAEPPTARALAALHLGRLGTPEARAVLMEHGVTGPDRLREEIARALGRTGGEEALDALRRAGDAGSARLAAQTRFAAALIAHRLGREGDDVAVDILPADVQELSIPAESELAVRVQPARPDTATRCLTALESDPYGVEYAEEALVELRFEADEWMVLLTREFATADGAQRLQRRKALLGVVAERDRVRDTYSVAAIMLSTPDRGSVRLHLHHRDGELVYIGRLEVRSFTIRTVERGDTLPLELDGRLENGRLFFDVARTAALTSRRRQARPLVGRFQLKRATD